jgi:hypothetical protein
VTRLGEVSPIRRLLSLGSCLKMTEVHCLYFWATLFPGSSCALFSKRMSCVKFWGIFSQTHLVTLTRFKVHIRRQRRMLIILFYF